MLIEGYAKIVVICGTEAALIDFRYVKYLCGFNLKKCEESFYSMEQCVLYSVKMFWRVAWNIISPNLPILSASNRNTRNSPLPCARFLQLHPDARRSALRLIFVKLRAILYPHCFGANTVKISVTNFLILSYQVFEFQLPTFRISVASFSNLSYQGLGFSVTKFSILSCQFFKSQLPGCRILSYQVFDSQLQIYKKLVAHFEILSGQLFKFQWPMLKN